MKEGLERALEQLVNLVRVLLDAARRAATRVVQGVLRAKVPIALAALAWAGYSTWSRIPVETLAKGEVGIRTNHLTGEAVEFREGSVMVVPHLHDFKRYSLGERLYRAGDGESATGPSPFQSSEGLALGVDLGVRYALDPAQLVAKGAQLPDDIDSDVVQPVTQAVADKVFSAHTVAEIFATKRADIRVEIERALKPELAQRGIEMRGVQIGNVDLVVPGVHELKHYSLRDQIYRPRASVSANGSAPLQSIEGLSLGVDLGVRYALDLPQLAAVAARLPDDVGAELVQPAVQAVMYKIFARYTMKEIFSTKRAEIQQAIEAELKPQLAQDGVALRAVQIGNVDLPREYRNGMEQTIAEELATEKMKHTLVLKEQQVRQSDLEAEAQRVAREKAAQAAANEQVIAAKAQEETMKHVLPFKQKQVQQRKLEAEAEKIYRIRQAQANAEARRIEAQGEADSRRKLAEADVYRLENVGKVNSEQLARDGATVQKYPLLIQKTMADKLSDKVSVIITAPPKDGSFIGSTLLGQNVPPVTNGAN